MFIYSAKQCCISCICCQVKQVVGSISATPEFDVVNRPFPAPCTWMTVHNATHYMKYAMGSYGWPLYVYMNPLTGCCQLCHGCRYCLH